MKTNWPVRKIGEIAVGVIITAFAIALFTKGQYLLCTLLILALIVLLRLDLIEELVFNGNEGIRVRFYKSELANLLNVPKDQIDHIHIERIRIEPYGNEVIIGIATIGNSINKIYSKYKSSI